MNAILVDDEPLALDFLERQIRKISGISIVRKFVDFNLKKDGAILQEIDIAFLDIEMPEMNGLELAGKILEIKPTMIIVFVTAFQEYAVQAFELDSLDYIVKPVQLDRLEKTLKRIEKKATYSHESPLLENNILRINVCRELSFETTKDNPKIVQWRIAKAQELFLYLLLHAGKTVRKSELAELLWPDIDFSNDYSQLYTAIYHVRKTLNLFCNHFSLKNTTDGYYLNIKNASIDLVEWENSIKSAPPINIKSIADYETIMELYTDSYLQEYDYLWAEPERYRLEMLWLKTADQIADFYFMQGDLERAETWYAKICSLRPEEESAHYSLMKIYDELGYGLLVIHQFAQLSIALKELGLSVSPYIQNWYDQWNSSRKG